jgi:hypothetical protein
MAGRRPGGRAVEYRQSAPSSAPGKAEREHQPVVRTAGIEPAPPFGEQILS